MVMENIFFTSDHHFGHRRIIDYSKRPYSSVEEMNEDYINKWNEVVSASDQVYHLGDFSFNHPKKTKEICGRLKGRIYLIRGNHDKKIEKQDLQFEWIKDYHRLKIDGINIILCHFPFEQWDKAHYGSWHLHGHSHGSLKRQKLGRIDVGVDTKVGYPWSYEEIRRKVEEQKTYLKYDPIDHHDEKNPR